MSLLEVKDLVVEFPHRRGTLRALDGVSFAIEPGEILGVVGESGAGKSLTGAAIIGLLEPPGRIASGEIWLEGKLVKLRPTEYRLLFHLVQNAGWVVSHDQLLQKVWGYEYRDEPHYVRLYINYLRQKLEKDPADPKYILTERGVGYRFVDYKRGKE